MKKVIIIGATSGLGYEVAKGYLKLGWKVGIAGRRVDALEDFYSLAPNRIKVQPLDITKEDASDKLLQLIDKMGGMNLFLLSSGIGNQNAELKQNIEINTARTNVEGFIRMTTTAFNYFRAHNGGQLAVISSIAGTKGLGIAPAYSATKRFQNSYIDALEQLSYMEKSNIMFTDVRPGFVATALLKDRNYPLLMKPEKVGKQIIHALNKKKRVAIIDYRYAILVFFWQMIPRWLWKRLPIKN